MSDPQDEQQGGEERERADPGSGEFRLPLGDSEGAEGHRLRRRLFGYRPDDVRAELESRNTEITELRRDVAALWLAFGQHERTIHEMLAALERATGARIDPPGGRADRERSGDAEPSDRNEESVPAPEGTPGPGPTAASLGEQLSGLDDVLAAIAEATQSLERSYADSIADPTDPSEGEAGEEKPPEDAES